MNIEDYIVKIANSKRKDKNIIVIALAGAGRIGKTTLTNKLQEKLGNPICEIIGLDGYMMDKKTAGNLGGYHPKRSDLVKARKEIKGLIYDKKSFNLPVYNHETHKHDTIKVVKPSEIIIIDGCFSLSDELLDFADIKIFLDASEEVQTILRQTCEQNDPDFSKEKFKKRIKNLLIDYRKYIFPTKEKADIILKTNVNHDIKIEQK